MLYDQQLALKSEWEEEIRTDINLLLDRGYVSRKTEVLKTAFEHDQSTVLSVQETEMEKGVEEGNAQTSGRSERGQTKRWLEYMQQIRRILERYGVTA